MASGIWPWSPCDRASPSASVSTLGSMAGRLRREEGASLRGGECGAPRPGQPRSFSRPRAGRRTRRAGAAAEAAAAAAPGRARARLREGGGGGGGGGGEGAAALGADPHRPSAGRGAPAAGQRGLRGGGTARSLGDSQLRAPPRAQGGQRLPGPSCSLPAASSRLSEEREVAASPGGLLPASRGPPRRPGPPRGCRCRRGEGKRRVREVSGAGARAAGMRG